MYHIVCPVKYRWVVISEEVDKTLKETCREREKIWDKIFRDRNGGDHVHHLVQSVPTYSPTKIVRTVKSITAKEIFERHPEVKEKLWGGGFWGDGHYVSTVGKHGNEETMANYVKAQGKGKDYKQLYKIRNDKNQPGLFN
jgi:REP element-mobilizing transposase RayT